MEIKIITAQLDEIANEVELHNPMIALAIDKISDSITSKQWSKKIKPKIKVQEDIFTEGADKIVTYLLGKGGGKAKAMQRLNFYMNRAGKNLTNVVNLEKAKKMLMQDDKE